MTEERKLDNPPIIEAVLDIDCDFQAELDFKKIEVRARKELAKSYPKLRRQFFHEQQFEAKVNETPKFSVKGGLQGLQFLRQDEKQLIQFRRQGFSFNRLAPYSSLDAYLPQIKKCWTLYAKLASPVQINSIRLRYINRILLPLVNGNVNFDEYLLNGPRVADPERLALVGFLNQYAAIDKKSGHQINSVITLQPVDKNDKLPIILDNGVVAVEAAQVDDWPWIRSKILELREVKNHIFWNTLKEKCLNQF